MRRLGLLAFIFLLALSTSAQWAAPEQKEVPAYNAAAPKPGAKLPPILAGDQLKTSMFHYPFQARAYEAAARNSKLIYQLPCYCYCDRHQGHNSLHSCFEGTHGANCSTCIQEAFYADKMAKLHKTPKQIRDGVIRGEYQQIDYQNYQ
jgi:hypothetical protein